MDRTSRVCAAMLVIAVACAGDGRQVPEDASTTTSPSGSSSTTTSSTGSSTIDPLTGDVTTDANPSSSGEISEASSSGSSAETSDGTSSTTGSSTRGACGDGIHDLEMPYCYAPPVVLDATPAFDLGMMDATGDGITDLVAATADGIAVFPGLGDDDFGLVELLPTPSAPARLRIAGTDLTPESTEIDLAAVCPASDVLVVYRSVLGEPVELAQIVPTGDEPVALSVVASWSGLLGFVIAEAGAGTVSTFVNDAGTFVLEDAFDVGGRPIAVAWLWDWIAVADADADLLSIIWLDPDAPAPLTSHPVDADPVRLHASWFGDIGGPKIMVLAEAADSVTIYGVADGELSELQSANFPGGPHAVAFGMAPVDESRTPILVAGRSAGTVALSPASTGRDFVLMPPAATLEVGPEPVALLTIVRDDGLDDIVVASPSSGVVLLRADP